MSSPPSGWTWSVRTAVAIVILIVFILLILFLSIKTSAATSSSTVNTKETNLLVEKTPQHDPIDIKEKDISFPVSLPWLALYGKDRSARLQPVDLTPCLEGLTVCYGQNPSSPYMVPKWNNTRGMSIHDQFMGLFEFDRTKAFVVVGVTPPPCTYFGYTFYLYTREGEEQVLFASVADTVNHLYFPEERRFNAPFAIVFSSNIPLSESLKIDLLKTIPESNVIVMPVLPYAGKFALLGRTNGFLSEQDKETFLSDPKTDLHIIKGNGYFADGPFVEEVHWKPRATEWNEYTDGPGEEKLSSEMTYYKGILNTFLRLSAWTPVQSYLFRSEVGLDYDSGQDCIAANINCLGDNRDTVYRIADFPNFTVDTVVIVIGVNHVKFKKAIMTNLSVYDLDRQLGIYSSDLYSPDSDFNMLILSKRPFDIPPELSLMNPILFLVPEEVQNVNIAERAYIQPLGNHNISAHPDTLLPFLSERTTFTEMPQGGFDPGKWVVFVMRQR